MVGELMSNYTVCAEAENGLQALTLSIEHKPDVALLDIRMPVMDGLQAAAEISKASPHTAIVFATAYDEHALAAFESNAIDYLLKPVKTQRLQKALEKAQQFGSAQSDSVSSLNRQLLMPRQHLCEHAHTGIRIVKLADILCFKAEQKYVCAMAATESILLSESLKSLEVEFAEHFVRVHRNALIRFSAIRTLEASKGQHQLLLNQMSEPIDVSRRHLAALRKRLASIR
jgi:two-component system response regulator AlgR